MLAVAAPGYPSDQIIAIRWRKRQNLYKLRAGFSRQLHQHKVRLHRLCSLRAALIRSHFRGDSPQVFPVIEDFGIGHVIEAIDFGL